jgi:hypothetical protein
MINRSMHETSANRLIGEKIGNFNNFRGLRRLAAHKSRAACSSIAAQHSCASAPAKPVLSMG